MISYTERQFKAVICELTCFLVELICKHSRDGREMLDTEVLDVFVGQLHVKFKPTAVKQLHLLFFDVELEGSLSSWSQAILLEVWLELPSYLKEGGNRVSKRKRCISKLAAQENSS